MEEAHDGMIWDLSWHPLGHMLVSGSNDRSTRFWTRNRPGDTFVDKVDDTMTPKMERSTGTIFKNHELPEIEKQKDGSILLPGLGFEPGMLEMLNEDNKEESSQDNYLFSPTSKQPQRNAPLFDADEDEKRKKAPYSKPIPKEFEKAWQSNKPVSQSNSNQPMSLMSQPLLNAPSSRPPSLLALNCEPANNSGFKRKLSQDFDNDYEDRNWKNRNQFNYEEGEDGYEEEYEDFRDNRRNLRDSYNENDSFEDNDFYDDRNRNYQRGRNSNRGSNFNAPYSRNRN